MPVVATLDELLELELDTDDLLLEETATLELVDVVLPTTP
jgi:hypothetical protein